MLQCVRGSAKVRTASLSLVCEQTCTSLQEKFWWVGQFSSRCSTVIGDVLQGHTAVCWLVA